MEQLISLRDFEFLYEVLDVESVCKSKKYMHSRDVFDAILRRPRSSPKKI